MARREEGEYSTYSTDEQRCQRVKDQARWEQNDAVEALGRQFSPHDGDGMAAKEHTVSSHLHAYDTAPRRNLMAKQIRLAQSTTPIGAEAAVS